MLGERTAEEIKIAVGSAYPAPDEPHAEIRGRDLVSGLPKTIVICAEEVRHAIQGPVMSGSCPVVARSCSSRGVVSRPGRERPQAAGDPAAAARPGGPVTTMGRGGRIRVMIGSPAR